MSRTYPLVNEHLWISSIDEKTIYRRSQFARIETQTFKFKKAAREFLKRENT